MPKRSAGLLLFRRNGRQPELLLVHPGGPFWAKKDDGAWSIPKGLHEEAENPLNAARREFEEETGCSPPAKAMALGHFKQPGGKVIAAFAAEGDFDLNRFRSNLFAMEWPPKSGKRAEFPEADRAGWFTPAEALRKVTKGQAPIVQALLRQLEGSSREDATERRDVGAMVSPVYRLFEKAMRLRMQIVCMYRGRTREICPVILGHTDGHEVALIYQFGGQSNSRLPAGGEWRCLSLSEVREAKLRDGPWLVGSRHAQQQRCVQEVDLDVNPDSPYRPKRTLERR